MNRPIVLSFLIALILMLVLFPLVVVCHFSQTKTIRLPQGYWIANVDTQPVLLLGPGPSKDTKLGPVVDGYLVYPGVIIGHISAKGSDKGDSGYFVIDMVTGKIDKQLDEKTWRSLLAGYDIIGDLKLHRPSVKDEANRCNRPILPWKEKRL